MKLISYFGSAEIAYYASNAEWKKAGMPESVLNERSQIVEKSAKAALNWQESGNDRHIVSIEDDSYPELLKIVDDSPMLLFLEGDITLLSSPQLGIVGSRHPTKEGEKNAYEFAKTLGQYGITITSGLAMGIDTFAHKGCVDFNRPTIAVLGTGLNKIYPSQNQSLAASIIEKGGCVVSEFPLQTPPIANNFPKRNRIISGLSLGVLVVEAAKKSGSLITARMAMEYGREVFAIPSSIHNPQSKGCHQLIRQGAKLVEDVTDIYEELKYWMPDSGEIDKEVHSIVREKPEHPVQAKIYEALFESTLTIDDLIILLNEESDVVIQALLMMEIEGIVIKIEGGQFKLS